MFTFISLIFVESATIFKYQLVIYPHWKTNNFAPENWWLEDEMSFGGKRPIFRCELLVSGREIYTASWWFFTNPFEKIYSSKWVKIRNIWEQPPPVDSESPENFWSPNPLKNSRTTQLFLPDSSLLSTGRGEVISRALVPMGLRMDVPWGSKVIGSVSYNPNICRLDA